MFSKFIPKTKSFKVRPMKTKVFNGKKVKILAIPPLLSPCSIKNNTEMKKRDVKKDSKLIKTKSYVQASSTNINNILKIKENFLNLLQKKIKEVNRVIYGQKKIKLKINIVTNFIQLVSLQLVDQFSQTKLC